MDKEAVKEVIKGVFVGEKLDFNEAAIDRFVHPRYFREDELLKLSDADAKTAAESVAREAAKRFRKRERRSSSDTVIVREIDIRTVVRGAFESNRLPWGVSKPDPKPAEVEGEPEAAEA